MIRFLLYMVEASALLVFFYLIYVVFLRRETFFQLNRFYLLLIPVFALVFPFARYDFNPPEAEAINQPLEEISKLRVSYHEAIAMWEFENRYAPSTDTSVQETGRFSDWISISLLVLGGIYMTGILVCLSKTAWTLRWFWRMHSRHSSEDRDGAIIVRLPQPTTPFSFFNYVFVHDTMVPTPDFDQILAHEKIHIKEKHSVDLIFVNLIASLFWFNPVMWRLIKSLKTTHEYIADEKIIQLGYSANEYQTLLLKQLISNNSHGLVHNFNLSFIKKRITMMTNKKSGWAGKLKVCATLIGVMICGMIIMQCNSKIDDHLAPESSADGAFAQGVNLPLLPASGFRFDGDMSKALNVTIVNDKITVNGQLLPPDAIAAFIEEGGHEPGVPVVMRIDKNQKMGLVRKVHATLREVNQRKIVQYGRTVDGQKVEFVLVLPPPPDHEMAQPNAESLFAEGKVDLIKIVLGDNEGRKNQEKVYDFVKGHMAKSSQNYVVSARFDDEDTYGSFLTNLFYVKEGFTQIYQERSATMFGKNFYQTTKEEYQAVREGIPMSISVAEK
jgi:hypothetical protein